AIAPSGTSVWVSSFASNTLTRITAAATAAAAPAVTASSVRTTSTGARGLPRGGEVVARIAVPPGGGALTVGEGAVWSMSDAASTLFRIDPATNRIVARI